MDGYDSLNTDELDTIIELVIAVIFMSFCLFATVLMIRSMDIRTQFKPRVDKVEMTYAALQDTAPFDFTGYQAYMFSWMMDGNTDTDLLWAASSNELDSDSSQLCTAIEPSKVSNGFVTYRNRVITGDNINESVQSVLYRLGGNNRDAVVNIYKGLSGDDKMFHLELTDKHVGGYDNIMEPNGFSIFEERKIYRWTLHPCD